MDLIFICINLCHTAISVTCSFEVDSWERFDLLALLYVMFSCVFVTFQYGVLGQVGYLIVSICDLFFLLWFLSKDCLHCCMNLCAKCMLHIPLFV